ncbi:hypothetical protein WR25_25671 [Diploscapter pachys]|uniref:Uncharacterized protein n=1 Tax=Diploscapter pachys TaxID=2018661 RepID=A0A2A2J6R8_9BILA|nr:hypothetical protein WR25_25671 [Diploscapter pachys]
MLGMMCSPNDNVEFYATKKEGVATVNPEDKKTFTDPKEKPVISYTPDGRRMVNGKLLSEDAEGNALWAEVLLRGAVSKTIPNKVGSQSSQEKEDNPEEENEAEGGEQKEEGGCRKQSVANANGPTEVQPVEITEEPTLASSKTNSKSEN